MYVWPRPWVWLLLLLLDLMPGVWTCSVTDDTCEFWLQIEHKLTMMDNNKAVYPFRGQLYNFDVTDPSKAQPVLPERVISADGWERPRLVIAVNGSMPGPPIEVYEDQTVVVHVTNLLHSTAITIHFHGLHQQGTPWSDGVAFVTQCPILPGQKFTYKFKADPVGTFWYHAHTGSQITMGLFGPFVVREREPMLIKEFIMMVQDWNHDYDSDVIHQKMLFGNYENRTKVLPSRSLEGAFFSMFPFQSGLINGRGRFYSPNGDSTQAPLTLFNVDASQTYRFRVVGAGSLYPFRVSIDGHPLTLIATDGYPILPVTVESFIINPGERYDFLITTNQSVDNYWVRAVSLEINKTNHIAEAILRYTGALLQEPTSQRTNCTSSERCLVVNCPFSYYPEEQFTDCLLLDSLESLTPNAAPGSNLTETEDIEDIFLNFAFPGNDWTPASVNGRQFLPPSSPALTQPQDINTNCDPTQCGEDQVCSCTYSVTLKNNKVYNLVFLNMGKGKGWAHPIHLHGHSFQVVKLGYPVYNNLTGQVIEDNLDIDCRGNPDRSKSFCNSARWSNISWGGNDIPGIRLLDSISKDTVIVPTGGYVVVRLRADNPGVWIMHCHIELHNGDGMALMINESFEQQPQAPADFPRCGNFPPTGLGLNVKSEGPDRQKLCWVLLCYLILICGLGLIV